MMIMKMMMIMKCTYREFSFKVIRFLLYLPGGIVITARVNFLRFLVIIF